MLVGFAYVACIFAKESAGNIFDSRCNMLYDKSKVQYLTEGWSSSFSIVTWLRAERRGFDSWQVKEIFLFSIGSRPLWDPWVLGALSRGVKATGARS
jgi:hypothetical protein